MEIHDGEAFLLRCHISPYEQAGVFNHEPERKRKLLLHEREIHRLDQKVKERGFSIVPLQAYFSDKGKIKVEIALVRGKREYEKKQKIKERDIRREMDRDVQRFRDKNNPGREGRRLAFRQRLIYNHAVTCPIRSLREAQNADR